MKSLVGKFGTLALVAMAGLTVAACSSSLDTSSPKGSSGSSDEHVGRIGLQLQPVLGITVANVHYTVTAGNAPGAAIVAEGNLPTPGTSSNFSFGIPLPVGTGYYLSLSGFATESPGTIKCSGSYGSFDVNANASSLFTMTLTCVDTTKGQLLTTVDVKTDACPRLIVDYAVAEPSAQDVGKAINVFSAAHDLDNAAEVITYAWSVVDPANAAVGSFAPATSKDTTFSCTGPGDSVRIKVTAKNHECSKALETVVSCKSLTCGNGVVEPALGETCDWKNDPTCPLDCTKVCGDGIAEGDEACDPLPLNPVACIPPGEVGKVACTARVQECGDGYVTGTEACDGTKGPNQLPLTNGDTCKADCTGINVISCGDGVTGGTEQCDAGTGTNAAPVQAPSRTCANQCFTVSTDACVACEQAGDCQFSSDNCLGPEAAPFTKAQQDQCFSVAKCIQDSNCLDGSGSLGKCYCGTLTNPQCSAASYDLTAAGAPNGPCAALMQAGSPGVTSNAQMLSGLTNKTRPAGAAGQRLNCDKTDPVCAPLCGVQ